MEGRKFCGSGQLGHSVEVIDKGGFNEYLCTHTRQTIHKQGEVQ
jgi:hypothetical protein